MMYVLYPYVLYLNKILFTLIHIGHLQKFEYIHTILLSILSSNLESCRLVFSFVKANIIQLMHSFKVDIRICQPENSDVHRGEFHSE